MTPEEIAAYQARLLRQGNVGAGMMFSGSPELSQMGSGISERAERQMAPSYQNLGMGVMVDKYGRAERPQAYQDAEGEARLFKQWMEKKKEEALRARPNYGTFTEYDSDTGVEHDVYMQQNPNAPGGMKRLQSFEQRPPPMKSDKDAEEVDLMAGQWEELINVMETTEGFAQPFESATRGIPGDIVGVFNEDMGAAIAESGEEATYTPEQRDVHALRDRLVELTRRPEVGANFTQMEKKFVERYMPSPQQNDDRQIRNAKIMRDFMKLKAGGRDLSRTELQGIAGGESDEMSSPQTQEDFDALPAGTHYIDPDDGQEYVK